MRVPLRVLLAPRRRFAASLGLVSPRRRFAASLGLVSPRRRFAASLGFASVLSCAAAGCAGAPPPTPEGAPQNVLPAERVMDVVTDAPLHVRAGSGGALALRLRIAPGYHVMSDQPSEPQYIPTRVTLDASPDIRWEAARFPVSQTFRVSDQQIATFAGELSVDIPFQVESTAAPGAREITGQVGYQACTEGSCLFPTKKAFALQLVVDR
jgi:DsbC/DsbD-like thiol-disulfide interchange protein